MDIDRQFSAHTAVPSRRVKQKEVVRFALWAIHKTLRTARDTGRQEEQSGRGRSETTEEWAGRAVGNQLVTHPPFHPGGKRRPMPKKRQLDLSALWEEIPYLEIISSYTITSREILKSTPVSYVVTVVPDQAARRSWKECEEKKQTLAGQNTEKGNSLQRPPPHMLGSAVKITRPKSLSAVIILL